MIISHRYTSPNYWVTDLKLEALVLHGTAGGFSGSLDVLCDPDRGDETTSASYLIDRDGTVYCLVNPYQGRRAWANGRLNRPDRNLVWLSQAINQRINPNLLTISIEHVAASRDMTNRNLGGLTTAQRRASLSLCLQLVKDFNLVPDTQTIIGHCQIDSVGKAYCPGVIDLAYWITWLKEHHMNEIKLAGKVITGRFKDFYLNTAEGTVAAGVHLFGLPLSNAVTAADGKTRQVFERYVMEYDPTIPDLTWQMQGTHAGKDWRANHLDLVP